MNRFAPNRLRVSALLLAGLLCVELAYVAIGSWFLRSRLAALGIRATRPFTAYPGDVRARRVELTAAGGIDLEVTDLHGRLRLSSLLDGSIDLTSLEAARLDVRVASVGSVPKKLAREEPPVASPPIRSASLLTSASTPRRLAIDRFHSRLGELCLMRVCWRGPGDVALSSVVFAPRLTAAVATAQLGGGSLWRPEREAPVGEAAGDIQLNVGAGGASSGDEPSVRMRATVRGAIEDTRALTGFGPALSIEHGVLEVQARGVRQGGATWKPGSTALTATVSGKGANAGALLILLDAPPAVRWMFEELNGQPYDFTLRGGVAEGTANIERLVVETDRTRAEGKLTFRHAELRGAVLLQRGALRMGVALAPGSTTIVTSPAPDWLERASAGPSP